MQKRLIEALDSRQALKIRKGPLASSMLDDSTSEERRHLRQRFEAGGGGVIERNGIQGEMCEGVSCTGSACSIGVALIEKSSQGGMNAIGERGEGVRRGLGVESRGEADKADAEEQSTRHAKRGRLDETATRRGALPVKLERGGGRPPEGLVLFGGNAGRKGAKADADAARKADGKGCDPGSQE